VGEKRYRVYRYEGSLKDLDDAVVLFAWKANQPMTPEHLHCVLSTDRELSDEEILRYYAQCWSIECFFSVSERLAEARWRSSTSAVKLY
jgi:IS4 transposase